MWEVCLLDRECDHKSSLNKRASGGAGQGVGGGWRGRPCYTHRRLSEYVNCSFWKVLKARQN